MAFSRPKGKRGFGWVEKWWKFRRFWHFWQKLRLFRTERVAGVEFGLRRRRALCIAEWNLRFAFLLRGGVAMARTRLGRYGA